MGRIKKNFEAIFMVVLCLMILLLFSVIVLTKIEVKYDNLIYSGIKINGEDVSFKDKEEAIQIINSKVIPNLKNKKITLNYGNKSYSYDLEKYEGDFDAEKAVDNAISFGKKANCILKYYYIKCDNNKNYNIAFTCSENGYSQLLSDIKKDIDILPQDASIVKKGDEFSITPDKKGFKIDEDDLRQKLNNILCYNIDNEIEVKCSEVQAKISAESLKKVKGIMGSYETDYSASSYERSNNIKIVTNLINGTVLLPGEEFSYGKMAKKGIGKYQNAPGYVEGKVVDVEGGGICQPCTTLYRAVMKSNIKSIERHPHMFKVSYTRPGLDATLGDWGTLDYKFINTYDFPIYIEGITSNGIVKFNIYGDPSALNGCSYDLQSDVNGLTASSYLVTFDKSGREINREFIAKDTYSSH